MRIGMIEVIHNVDEFLEILSDGSRIHYELYWRPIEYSRETGLIYEIEAGINLYGLAKEGHIVVCNIFKRVTWESPELRKYNKGGLHEDYNAWIKDVWKEFEEIASSLKATKGRFEWRVENGFRKDKGSK